MTDSQRVAMQSHAINRVLRVGTEPMSVSKQNTVVITRGNGAKLWDDRGREYIDASGGLGAALVGHGREEIIESIHRQLSRLSFMPASFWGGTHDRAVELAERLCTDFAAERVSAVSFCCSGSEAVEGALKYARHYWKIRGYPEKVKVLSLQQSYHGTTAAALAATGMLLNRRPFEPMVPGFINVSALPTSAFHAPVSGPRDAVRSALDSLIQEIEKQGADTISALIVEPVLFAGGVIVPPEGLWRALRGLCDHFGILLIADEVVTGFGRIGHALGVRRWGVVPDLLCVAKGITSGYAPLGATLLSERVFSAWTQASSRFAYVAHGHTFGGHPASCAAAIANLDIIEREGLRARALESGERLIAALSPVLKLPIVREIRSEGLLVGIELGHPKDFSQPLNSDRAAWQAISDALTAAGLMVRLAFSTLVISPPLIISNDEIDTLADRIYSVLHGASEGRYSA